MTTKIFKYSLLQYVHSQLLGEQLNLGILFYFPTLGIYAFRSSNRIKQVKSLYKDFPYLTVVKYLREFEKGADNQKESNEDFERFIEYNFLTKDSAPLQFSKPQTALLYSSDIDSVIEHHVNLYFHQPEKLTYNYLKGNDLSQVDRFKNILLSQKLEINSLVRIGIVENEKASFKPDLAWQNGSINLIKEIQFNELSEEKIKDKALLLNNKLNYLSKEIISKNYRIDLFVSRPSKRNLIDSYEVALGILNDSPVPKRIIEENQLTEYSIDAVNEIRHRTIGT